MRSVHLITVGKLKNSALLEFERNYRKRINSFYLEIHESKAYAEDLTLEARDVLLKIKEISKKSSSIHLCALMENGLEQDSPQFAKWITQHFELRKENI